MEVVEFQRALKRYCEHLGYDYCDKKCYICEKFGPCVGVFINDGEVFKSLVTFIEQWAKDNPVKTYRDVLKERLENFDLGILDHYNFLRPASVFGVEHHGKEWDDEYIEVTK